MDQQDLDQQDLDQLKAWHSKKKRVDNHDLHHFARRVPPFWAYMEISIKMSFKLITELKRHMSYTHPHLRVQTRAHLKQIWKRKKTFKNSMTDSLQLHFQTSILRARRQRTDWYEGKLHQHHRCFRYPLLISLRGRFTHGRRTELNW